MSKFTEALRTIGVVNDCDFAGHGNVLVSYRPRGDGRSCLPSGWGIHRPGYKTNPKGAAWYEYGDKYFNNFGVSDKQQALDRALAWASQRYGIKHWARTPFGAYMDAEFVKTRTAELKKQLQAGQRPNVDVPESQNA